MRGFTSYSFDFSSIKLLFMLSVSLTKFPFMCLVLNIPNTTLDNLCASSISCVLENNSQIFLYSAFLLLTFPFASAIWFAILVIFLIISVVFSFIFSILANMSLCISDEVSFPRSPDSILFKSIEDGSSFSFFFSQYW